MKVYPTAQLYEEMVFIAYHLHWSHAELVSLEHGERRRRCEQVSAINRRLDDAEVRTSLEHL